jgi:hypothetical protein
MTITKYRDRCWFALLALLCWVACSRVDRPAPLEPARTEAVESSSAPVEAAPDQAAGPSVAELVEPYPPGRWRLADRRRLQAVRLWFSHILVRHRDVPAGLVSFQLPLWTSAPPPPERTREQAFALAQDLAERARREPGAFAELVRTYSEDIATRELGGSVGGMDAEQLYRYPTVLDVMAATKPGEVSRVVETGYGFHVFLRRSPPPAAAVSGARIVITHHDAPWTQRFFARRALPARSKSEAEALAGQIYARAKADPWSFPQLVEEYTEHSEALRGGDFGAWSALERTPFPREVEILRGLEIGEVAPPIDSLFGIQIIQRTSDRPRARYTATWIKRTFDPSVPETDPDSEAAVAASLRSIAKMVSADPARFPEFQRDICCTAIQHWLEGAGEAELEPALDRLGPGQIAAEPTRLPHSYVLLKRLAAPDAPAAPVLLDLPAPERPELDALLGRSIDFEVVAELGRALSTELPIERAQAAELAALHRTFATSTNDDDLAAYQFLQVRARELLGSAYGDYVEKLYGAVEAAILSDAGLESRLALPRAPS